MLTREEWHSQSYEDRSSQLDVAYTYYHSEKYFRGGIWHDIPFIANLFKQGSYRTLLDYGAGDGLMWRNLTQVQKDHIFLARHLFRFGHSFEVNIYDKYSQVHNTIAPGKRWDMVMCNDVLEHVLVEDIPSTLKHIFSLANKAVYLNISTQKASKQIVNEKGVAITDQDLHVTVKDAMWWLEEINKAEVFLRDSEHRFITVYTKFDKYV